MKSKAICILGMHRSGTSAMARALTSMGYYVGNPNELLPADRFNVKGYYERFDVTALNEAILCSHALNDLPLLKESNCFRKFETLDELGWIFGAWGLPLREIDITHEKGLKACIDSLFLNAPAEQTCLIKDPRLSLTIPFWLQYIKESSAIIMIRNPSDVAASLYRRNRILPRQAFDLWFLYTQSALDLTKTLPRLVINYDELLDSPAKTLRIINDFLTKDGFMSPDDNYVSAIHSLSSQLRTRNNSNEFSPPKWIYQYYKKIITSLHGSYNLEQLPVLPKLPSNHSWMEALYIPACLALLSLQQDHHVQMARLNHHPITGPIIAFLRRLKHDPSFGSLIK